MRSTRTIDKTARKLSDRQEELLHSLRSSTVPENLVSGREYQTALALERRGLATVRYQGPTMGWARATTKEARA